MQGVRKGALFFCRRIFKRQGGQHPNLSASTEIRSGYLLPVVGQASCLSIAAKKLREIFAGLFAGHGRLEACPTNQRRFDFGVRVEEKHGAASAALANRKS